MAAEDLKEQALRTRLQFGSDPCSRNGRMDPFCDSIGLHAFSFPATDMRSQSFKDVAGKGSRVLCLSIQRLKQ